MFIRTATAALLLAATTGTLGAQTTDSLPATPPVTEAPAMPSVTPAPLDSTGSIAPDAAAEPADVSAWMGLPVVSADGVTVGKVEDVELGPDGQPVAVTTSVGGFLGFGATEVRLPVGAANFDGREVRIGMVETDVEALAEGGESAVGIRSE